MRIDTFLFEYHEDGSVTIDCKIWDSYKDAYAYARHRKRNQQFIIADTDDKRKHAWRLMGAEVKE